MLKFDKLFDLASCSTHRSFSVQGAAGVVAPGLNVGTSLSWKLTEVERCRYIFTGY